jgi:hypothetical protein
MAEPSYTVFIRLPFERGDFVDPPPVSHVQNYVRANTFRSTGTRQKTNISGSSCQRPQRTVILIVSASSLVQTSLYVANSTRECSVRPLPNFPNSTNISSAEKFQVSLPFLLQQAAWLYERQFSQVRAQMRKVAVPKSTPSDSTGGEAMRRTGSGGGGPLHHQAPASPLTYTGPRAPSALSFRKDSPLPRVDGGVPGTPSRAQGNYTPPSLVHC